MKHLYLVLVAAVVLSTVEGYPPGEHYCGRRLVEVLKIVCGYEYAAEDISIGDFQQSQQDHQGALIRQTRSTGLMEECCERRCYIAELLNYC